MSQIHDAPDFQEIFDAKGTPLGAMLGPAAWALVRETVLGHFSAPLTEPEIPEPLADWKSLVQNWDFGYPVDLDVACTCGNATEDWRQDEPRKFWLLAANMGGLVTFRCLACQARILKRHFDDSVVVEVRPFAPEKSLRNKGRAS